MKKPTRIILLIALLAYPSICFPSHVIKLKNGNELIIYGYWEDGGQIRFYSYGGVVGIQKAVVREIRKGDLTYVIDEPKPPKGWQEHAETKDKSPLEDEKKTSLLDPGDKAFLEEKRLVMLRMSAVSGAFREAKGRNNRKQMEEEREKLLASQKELSRILKKVRNVHGGRVPTW